MRLFICRVLNTMLFLTMSSAAPEPKKIVTEDKVLVEDQKWEPHPGRVKIKGSKTSTDTLMEMRAEESY